MVVTCKRRIGMLKKALITTASIAGLMAVVCATPAAAGPITFTWDPSAVGLGGTSITADNLTTSDYSVITVNPANLSNVTESGYLPITSFNLNGVDTSTGSSPYTLYFHIISTTSTLDGNPATDPHVNGYFTDIQYSLVGNTGTCAFNATTSGPTATCTGTDMILASGDLNTAPGPDNQVNVNFGIPSADALVDITAAPGKGGFFVSPADIGAFNFLADFTNNSSDATLSTNLDTGITTIVVKGGGGSVDLLGTPVPEPLTLSLFGAGLAGVAALRRRRSKKA